MSTEEDKSAIKRSYGQYCGLARALDVVGNRWSLLIVRELLGGPARYGKLQAGLPGISTNLLAERLRELEQSGVVQRQLDTDSNSVAYTLTAWGRELRGAVTELVNWSTPLMIAGPHGDSFQPHWLVVALESLMEGKRTEVPASIGFEVYGMNLAVRVDETGARVALEVDGQPETVLRAEPMVVLGLASGMLTAEQAIAAGELRGESHDLDAIFGP
ncbi:MULTISPECIES: winged helix-turn-helix transcriptional regulator [unclassified Rhodococcus (in: high G+C Gram-positive bacteria)]|uniref:winged helix-turn-helix transcriptional regulator n=1 Tax=unclassified Rhodococcus (in: high G+C Gram-positive bacteria) TaxID=192944 RepID=UPI001AE888E9|nr:MULTISPECIES: helix-turn-helix domain-containing protein [unclassified Rhodococcus (in: high G+C Gram-positive bacteria)]MBP2524220.1 DNA-binding HxlR family transcriptional regulator [Rhodococcus sp. PvP104]MDA3637496.1 helix-turn-helix domain-containing protein [Rhodococcus sp. C-2]